MLKKPKRNCQNKMTRTINHARFSKLFLFIFRYPILITLMSIKKNSVAVNNQFYFSCFKTMITGDKQFKASYRKIQLNFTIGYLAISILSNNVKLL